MGKLKPGEGWGRGQRRREPQTLTPTTIPAALPCFLTGKLRPREGHAADTRTRKCGLGRLGLAAGDSERSRIPLFCRFPVGFSVRGCKLGTRGRRVTGSSSISGELCPASTQLNSWASALQAGPPFRPQPLCPPPRRQCLTPPVPGIGDATVTPGPRQLASPDGSPPASPGWGGAGCRETKGGGRACGQVEEEGRGSLEPIDKSEK